MSIIPIHLGQCGNQIGALLLNEFYEDYLATTSSIPTSLFRTSMDGGEEGVAVARSILVDFEPKVIEEVFSSQFTSLHNPWSLDPFNILHEQCGAGNNWTLGYHSSSNQPIVEGVVERVRGEVEKSDVLDSFLLIHSLAGGTGSGVGSKLTEILNDEFTHSSNTPIMNVVVFPHTAGEVIVQPYNAMLSLSSLSLSSSSILCFHNDQLRDVCTTTLSLQRPSLNDFNSVIVKHLSSFLLPKPPVVDQSDLFCPSLPLTSSILQLTPHPFLRFLSSSFIPQVASHISHFESVGMRSVIGSSSLLSQRGCFVDHSSFLQPTPTKSKKQPPTSSSISSSPISTLDLSLGQHGGGDGCVLPTYKSVSSQLILRGGGEEEVPSNLHHDFFDHSLTHSSFHNPTPFRNYHISSLTIRFFSFYFMNFERFKCYFLVWIATLNPFFHISPTFILQPSNSSKTKHSFTSSWRMGVRNQIFNKHLM